MGLTQTAKNGVLYNACKENKKQLALEMINKGARVNSGLLGACECGNRELAQIMIDKGADNFNIGLNYASRNKHEDLVYMMVYYGADNSLDGFDHIMDRFSERFILKLMVFKKFRTYVNNYFKDFLCDSELHVKNYLINRHALCDYEHTILYRMHSLITLRNMGRLFMCDDIGKFLMRFVGCPYRHFP